MVTRKAFIVGVFSNFEGEEYTNFTTVTEALCSDYDFGHTSDVTVLPLKDSPINPPFIRLFKPFDEQYSDSQDFTVDSVKKFVEEASMPLVAVLTKDPDSHTHVIKFFNSPGAKALFF